MNTTRNMNDFLNKLAMDKIDYISNTLERNGEFDYQNELIDNINNKLKEILTKEQMSLVGDLQDEINAYSGMLETEIYLQGLKDGVELSKILNI